MLFYMYAIQCANGCLLSIGEGNEKKPYLWPTVDKLKEYPCYLEGLDQIVRVMVTVEGYSLQDTDRIGVKEIHPI